MCTLATLQLTTITSYRVECAIRNRTLVEEQSRTHRVSLYRRTGWGNWGQDKEGGERIRDAYGELMAQGRRKVSPSSFTGSNLFCVWINDALNVHV